MCHQICTRLSFPFAIVNAQQTWQAKNLIGMTMATFVCCRGWSLASLRVNSLSPTARSVSFGLLSRDARVRWQPSTRAMTNISNSDAFANQFRIRMQRALNTSYPRPSKLLLQTNVAGIRTFQHMSQGPDHGSPFSTTTSPPPASTPRPPKDAAPKAELDMPTAAQQRRTDWTIVKRLMVNVWPKNDWKTRLTVVFGFLLLVTAKVVYFLPFCCRFFTSLIFRS